MPGPSKKGLPPQQVAGHLIAAQKTLVRERALWAYHAFVVQNHGDVQVIRKLLALTPKDHRKELRKCYVENSHLGEPFDPKIQQDMVTLIDFVELFGQYHEFILLNSKNPETLRDFLLLLGGPARKELRRRYQEKLPSGSRSTTRRGCAS